MECELFFMVVVVVVADRALMVVVMVVVCQLQLCGMNKNAVSIYSCDGESRVDVGVQFVLFSCDITLHCSS